jgi:predicted membrane protein
LHVSSPSQVLPFEQLVPAETGVCVTPSWGSQASVVQGFPSSVDGGVPKTQIPKALHVSGPSQKFPFEQLVPTRAGVCTAPWKGSQLSIVHGLPSSTFGGVPATQVPAPSHVSLPLQRFSSPQCVPAGLGVCVTPPVMSQASAVHGFPSSSSGGVPGTQVPVALQTSAPSHALPFEQLVPAETGVWLTPVTGSHASAVHGLLSSVAGGVPGEHVPDEHVSEPLHTVPSGHGVPSGLDGFEQVPVAGLQVPASWHWSLAVQTTGFAPVHVPAWHASLCVQASASLHAEPSAFAGSEQVPLAGSHVPASWHWSLGVQTTGLPPVHVPAWHVSACVQASSSLQGAPFGRFGFEQTPVAGLQRPVS